MTAGRGRARRRDTLERALTLADEGASALLALAADQGDRERVVGDLGKVVGAPDRSGEDLGHVLQDQVGEAWPCCSATRERSFR